MTLLAAAVHARHAWLEAEGDVAFSVMGVATRWEGFVYRDAGFGLDLDSRGGGWRGVAA